MVFIDLVSKFQRKSAMKKAIYFLTLVLLACDRDDSQSPSVSYLHGLFPEHETICVGHSTRLHLIKNDTQQEIPISEINFEALDPSHGILGADGTYNAPSSISGDFQVIPIRARFKKNSSEIITGTVHIVPGGQNPDTWVKEASNKLAGRFQYDRFDNGDFLFANALQDLGFDPKTEFELVKVSARGNLLERKTFGRGGSIFVKIKNGKIYAVGYRSENPPNNGSLMVLDELFQVEKEVLLPAGTIRSMAADSAGNVYLNITEEYGNTLLKVNKEGVVWKENIGYEFLSIDVLGNGKIAGLVRIPENFDKEALALFNENGQELWIHPTGRNATESIMFLTSNGQIGLASHQYTGYNGSGIWIRDTFNLDGSITLKNEAIHSSHIPGSSLKPNEKPKHLGALHEVFVSKSGEIYFLGTASWTNGVLFLELIVSRGHKWTWWLNKGYNTGGVTPLGISEVNDGIHVLANVGNRHYAFRLQQDLGFSPCVYPPYWPRY